MNEEIDAIEAVSRAVDRITRRGKFADFELSNGIVLTLKPVPPLLVQAINQEFVQPPPPKVFIEEKGRNEENPNDPQYQRDLLKFSEAQELAINDLLLGVGSSVKYIPEGYYPPESDEWIRQVEFAINLGGKEVHIDKDEGIKRYLCWLRFYAMETGADVALCSGLIIQLGGIQEREIDEVVEAFQRVPERGTDTDGTPAPISENGHTANRSSRRSRPRNRGT